MALCAREISDTTATALTERIIQRAKGSVSDPGRYVTACLEREPDDALARLVKDCSPTQSAMTTYDEHTSRWAGEPVLLDHDPRLDREEHDDADL